VLLEECEVYEPKQQSEVEGDGVSIAERLVAPVGYAEQLGYQLEQAHLDAVRCRLHEEYDGELVV
jgi:hypothetical protein